MMRDYQIEEMHRLEDKYERECRKAYNDIMYDFHGLRHMHKDKLNDYEWDGLHDFIQDYEIEPETTLEDIAVSYAEMLSDRYNFIIYR